MADKDFLIRYDEELEENILCRYVGKDKIIILFQDYLKVNLV